MQRAGSSYSRLLLGLITLVWLMSFLIASANALIAIIAPMVVGIVAAFGVERRSNLAKGLFVILTYVCTLFSKMMLSSAPIVLTRGIIEAQTGIQVFWSQWLVAFLPAVLPTVVAAWLTVRWLYPVKAEELPEGQRYLQDTISALGPWSGDEEKTLAVLLLAICLWATDFLHQMSPAVIVIGVGLLLVLPKVGVLDTKALNLLLGSQRAD